MTWLHGIMFPLTCGLLPACPPYTHGNNRHQARVKGAIKLAIKVCVYKVLVSCVGSVAVLPAENNPGLKRGVLWVASMRERIVGCYIQTGIPAMLDWKARIVRLDLWGFCFAHRGQWKKYFKGTGHPKLSMSS